MLRIMPMGDSITAGEGSSDGGGYRAPLFRRLFEAGQRVTFVGGSAFADGPAEVSGVPFPRAHEGYPGVMVDGLQVLAAGTVTNYAPDIVLLMTGANDDESPTEVFAAKLGTLLDSILEAGPAPRLIVSTVTPTRSDARDRRVDDFNAAIVAAVERRAVDGRRVSLVDVHAAFRANPDYRRAYLVDIVHPRDAGYEVIAGCWYDALVALSCS